MSSTSTTQRIPTQPNPTPTAPARAKAAPSWLGMVCAGAIGAACVLGWSALTPVASATAQAQPAARPITVATVELQRLMDNLKELDAANAALRARTEAYNTQMKELDTRAKAIEDELANTIPKDALQRRAEKRAEQFEIRALMEARRDTFRRLLELEQGDVIKAAYDRVVATASAFAQREGYDLVMLNDTAIGFEGEGRRTLQEVTSVIRSRKLLHASASVDVTDRLVTIMNNEFDAGVR